MTTWLNTPGGVKALNLSTTADSYGRIWLKLKGADLPTGTNSLVVYGNRSRITALGAFVVQR